MVRAETIKIGMYLKPAFMSPFFIVAIIEDEKNEVIINMTIAKIRGQDHSLDVYPISIGKGGVRILEDQVPFSLVEKEEGFK